MPAMSSGFRRNCRQKSTCLIDLKPMRSSVLTLLQVQESTCIIFSTDRKNAIYSDTDSVIFIQPCAEPWLVGTGDNLGDMQCDINPLMYSRIYAKVSKRIVHTG